MDNTEQLVEWFEKHEDLPEDFEGLQIKFSACKQASAIMFLASKLKDESQAYFLHGEHDTLYIGSDFDDFEDFTEEEVIIAIHHGITIADTDEGFQIYASL